MRYTTSLMASDSAVTWRTLIAFLLFGLFARSEAASADASKLASTFYVARVSSEGGWEDVFVNPIGADYIDDYLAVAALSRTYGHYYDGALSLEAEGNTAYHFGHQQYWEFNAIPVEVRWHRFPWNRSIATT